MGGQNREGRLRYPALVLRPERETDVACRRQGKAAESPKEAAEGYR